MPVYSTPLHLDARVIEGNIDRLVAAWAREILRRFQTEVVPAARNRLPYRTGRLFRSVRVQVRKWHAVVYAEFYGAFLVPNFEALLREEWRKRRGTITRQAYRVARAKTGSIFGG